MSKQKISILGPIGSFKINGVQYNGVQVKDVMIAVSTLPEDTTELEIDVAGPGGHKQTGDTIYNYLMTLKPRMKLITNQVGDIGSISTKLFLVGDERVALDGVNPETGAEYEFFVHNPWNTGVSGDAATLASASESAKVEQDELAGLYVEKTGLTLDVVEPLMQLQTGFSGKEALALKFATSIRSALNTAAYMTNDQKTLSEKIDGLLATVTKFMSGKSSTLAMVLELENGTKISVASEDAAKLEGVAAMTIDATGVPTTTPVADGSYKLKDGSKTLTVTGGKVAKVDAATPAATPSSDAEVTLAKKVEDLSKLVALMTKTSEEQAEAKRIADIVAVEVAKGIEAFKATQTTTHRPPHKDVIIDFKTAKETPVQARNRENAEREVALKQSKK